jgi:predicted outer membrane protein
MKKMTVPALFLCPVLYLAAAAASAQTTNQGAVMPEAPASTAPGARNAPLGDAEFVRSAAIANRFEIEEAQLALTQGSDPRLKEFARTMVMDHGVALKDLETAARMAGVTVPDRKLDDAHQARINAISRKKAPTSTSNIAPTSGRPTTRRSRSWSPTSRAAGASSSGPGRSRCCRWSASTAKRSAP